MLENRNETKGKWSHSVVSDSSRPHGLYPTRLLCPWTFPGKSTGVGCHFLLQGIFSTQGSNPGLPHCRQTLYHLSHQGSWGGPKVDVFKQGVSPSVCHRPHHSPLLHTIPLTQASCHVTQAPDNTGVWNPWDIICCQHFTQAEKKIHVPPRPKWRHWGAGRSRSGCPWAAAPGMFSWGWGRAQNLLQSLLIWGLDPCSSILWPL